MAKDIIGAYRAVCRDLIGLQAYEKSARSRLEAAHKTVFMGKMPSSTPCYVPLTTALTNYDYAVVDYNETTQAIDELIGVKVQIESTIAKMSEPEQIIIILHVEHGLNLRDIADKSNYSYGYLRRLAGEMRRMEKMIS